MTACISFIGRYLIIAPWLTEITNSPFDSPAAAASKKRPDEVVNKGSLCHWSQRLTMASPCSQSVGCLSALRSGLVVHSTLERLLSPDQFKLRITP